LGNPNFQWPVSCQINEQFFSLPHYTIVNQGRFPPETTTPTPSDVIPLSSPSLIAYLFPPSSSFRLLPSPPSPPLPFTFMRYSVRQGSIRQTFDCESVGGYGHRPSSPQLSQFYFTVMGSFVAMFLLTMFWPLFASYYKTACPLVTFILILSHY